MTAPWKASWLPVKPEVGMMFRWYGRRESVGALLDTNLNVVRPQGTDWVTRTIDRVDGDGGTFITSEGGLWSVAKLRRLTANGAIVVIRSSRLTQPCRKGRRR